MSNEPAKEQVKKATRISTEAHTMLKEYCDRTGRTQIDVLSELTLKVIQPELKRLKAEAKG